MGTITLNEECLLMEYTSCRLVEIYRRLGRHFYLVFRGRLNQQLSLTRRQIYTRLHGVMSKKTVYIVTALRTGVPNVFVYIYTLGWYL